MTLECRLLFKYLNSFGQSLAVTSILLRLNSRRFGQNAKKCAIKSCELCQKSAMAGARSWLVLTNHVGHSSGVNIHFTESVYLTTIRRMLAPPRTVGGGSEVTLIMSACKFFFDIVPHETRRPVNVSRTLGQKRTHARTHCHRAPNTKPAQYGSILPSQLCQARIPPDSYPFAVSSASIELAATFVRGTPKGSSPLADRHISVAQSMASRPI